MHKLIFTVLIFLHPILSTAGAANDTLIRQLVQTLSQKNVYDAKKDAKINSLRSTLEVLQPADLNGHFAVYRRMYNEYRSYQYDSAYVYADRLRMIAIKTGDIGQQEESKIKLAFILLSSGKYMETFSILHSVKQQTLNAETKQEFYSVMSRAYFDLAAYDKDRVFSTDYLKKGNAYLDSSLAMSAPGSYSKMVLTGYRYNRSGMYRSAIEQLLKLDSLFKPELHESAIVASMLSEAYAHLNQPEKAERYLIISAIGDLRSATKETQALFKLAELTYKKGNIDHAYLFIQEAMNQADFYGARQRQVQISSVLALLTAQKVSFLEKQRQRFFIYSGSISALTVLVLFVSILLYKQLRQRKAKELVIEQNNLKLNHMNLQLKEVNKLVVQANQKFAEDAHIKEEYIGNFFNIISEYILKLERLKTTVEAKVMQNKTEQLLPVVQGISIHKERNELYNTFDRVFLKIFPNFITAFNSLFNKEDHIVPKDHEMLTTDLRIFALIRLGISDNESIAKILEYTAKTVYVYKMRVKARSIFPSDEFDRRVMHIEAVENPHNLITDELTR